MFRIFIAATVVAALGGAASAADVPVYKAKPLDPAPYWSGFYAGGHGGYGWFERDVNVTFVDGGGTGVAGTVAAGALPLTFSRTRGGFIGGGQVGFNHQTGNWVTGIEADFSGTSFDATQTRNTNVAPFFALTTSATQDLQWFGTVRPRLGYAWNNVLTYVTGGLAYGSLKYAYTQSNIPAGGTVNIAVSNTQTTAGWTAGAGAEYGFGNKWSLKFEYLYFDLGDRGLRAPNPVAPATVFFPRFDNTGHIVRIGLNYRFNSTDPWAGR
jgi:outer membrane immunogenic protein